MKRLQIPVLIVFQILLVILTSTSCGSGSDGRSSEERDRRDSASYYNEKGLVESTNENYQLALKYFDQAIGSDSTFSKPYNNKGTVFNDLQFYEQAIAEFNKAIKIAPSDGLVYHNRARAKESMKNLAGACEDWKIAIKLDFEPSENYFKRFCE